MNMILNKVNRVICFCQPQGNKGNVDQSVILALNACDACEDILTSIMTLKIARDTIIILL